MTGTAWRPAATATSQNALAATEFNHDWDMAKIGKPVDRSEWGMSPQTVNAYYNPLKNEIVFPAAILQPPFFDPKADPALNYGGIGAVIGHEMMHGYDDQGSQFDAKGNSTTGGPPPTKTVPRAHRASWSSSSTTTWRSTTCT